MEESSQFSRSVVSDSLRLHGLQPIRRPWPSTTPGVYSNSRPSSQWCQDWVSPTVSLSHQEAFISLLSFSIRGQTENHNHRKLNNLITWTTALSNSMQLRAMPCRAIQDRWVMVAGSDKMWLAGEGNDKPLQYSCLENPMNSMKMGYYLALKRIFLTQNGWS